MLEKVYSSPKWQVLAIAFGELFIVTWYGPFWNVSPNGLFLLSRMDFYGAGLITIWSPPIVCMHMCMCEPRCLDVAIEVSLALYLLEFPDVRYWNIDLRECLAFTLLWFHLYAHTADARFTQHYKLQMWQYKRDQDQIKLSINAGWEKKKKI